ncbi:Neuropathy target esterase sws [Echinococcus granulosus]|uniref:Neuropathy target esterase sws n=1 Tax=Echinococcus granulosus TaxID=6210 RepID=W6UJF6_ECHGR|nr:Neuropathy target esterase sws [Echinococcus granulosus]EUB61173.1 Neuropathy target esterase sws [Echinococcus granulosus]
MCRFCCSCPKICLLLRGGAENSDDDDDQITKGVADELAMPEDACLGDSTCFFPYLSDESFDSITGGADSSDLLSKLILSTLLLFIILPLIAIVIWKLAQRLRYKVPFQQEHKVTRFRFRNRDKIRYYAIRLSRNFNAIASKSRDEQRKLIIGYVKRLFSGDSEGRNPLLKQRNLPESFFEPESGDESGDMPEDLKLMVNHVRMLSYLGRDVVQALSSVISTIDLRPKSHLFRDGDPEDKIYVVKSGRLDLKVTDTDGSSTVIHEVTAGGNPYSLLAIVDAMNNNKPRYHNIEAVAVIRSKVVCLAISDLIKVCRDYPPANLRLAQMTIIRLHRVTFAALHNFFGLDKELFSQERQTFLKDSAVESFLKRLDERSKNASNSDSRAHKRCKSKTARLMPEGSVTANHLVPTRKSIAKHPSTAAKTAETGPAVIVQGTGSLDEVGPLVSTSSVSKLLELGEVADNASNCAAPSTPATAAKEQVELIYAAQEDLARLFGISEGATAFGKNMISVVEVNPGELISKETEPQLALYYILSGGFVITQLSTGVTKSVPVLRCTPGELIGLMCVITGEANNCSAQASVASRVAVLSRDDFFRLVRSYPQVLINAANLVSLRLSRLLRLADFAVEWHGVDAGKALYKQGDSSNYVYVVLNGRFREVHTNSDGSRNVITESGRGAFLGYVEVTSAKPRMNTVLAIRDSEVVKVPSILLNWLKRLTPHPVSRFIQLLSDRLMQPTVYGILEGGQTSSFGPFVAGSYTEGASGGVPQQSHLNAAGSGGAMTNLRAIAILATSPDINTEAFTLELQHAMSVFGSSVRLTSDIVKKRLGENALESINDYRLCSWLSHQEDVHRMVFYIADSHCSPSAWTRRCLRQADCVVLLALASADDPTKLSPIEQAMSCLTTKVTKILVLLYPLETEYPPAKRTAAWLNTRPWVTQHYHIRCPPRVLNPTVKDLIAFYSQVFLLEEPNQHSDMSRLARYLTGQAVGLVLGGGGAKGAAHVGVIRVLQEAGIPIDMVGGTSIGALIGAMWSEETRVAQLSQRSRDFARVFKSIWPKLRDITYPTVSLFSGYEFNSHIESIFKDRQIEDLWVPYFCVTTDISNCKMRVHTSGWLWRYVRSSMTYPLLLPPLCDPSDGHYLIDGVFVNILPGSPLLHAAVSQSEHFSFFPSPLIRFIPAATSIYPSMHPQMQSGSLWRYVRASMSLSGYMPPLCDPVDGSYLLDGGYVNNVPADVMVSFGAKTVYAVDVGSVYDTNLTNYGDWLSGWWLIYQRFFRWWGPPIRVPNFTEIQSRLAYISCIRQLEEVKASGICHYLRPPIDRFMTLQFAAFEEIMSVGYKYAKETLAMWQETGAYQQMIPALYKRARSGSSSSGISSTHRKTRSISIGVTAAGSNSGTAATVDDNAERNSSRDDSGVFETPIKRRLGSMENVSPKDSTSGETRTRPDFDGEWCKTWLRLHPERISHLAMGSTAFDKPDDAKVLSMAEQWLYAPTARFKDKRQQLHQRYRQHQQQLVSTKLHVGHPFGADLVKSATLDGVMKPHYHHSPKDTPPSPFPSGSDAENRREAGGGGRSHSRHSNRVGGTSFDDDFLVTASDPELSSLRFTSEGRLPASPMVLPSQSAPQSSSDSRARWASVPAMVQVERAENVEEEEVGGEDADPVVAVVKAHRHRPHRRGSLNKVLWEPLFPYSASEEQLSSSGPRTKLEADQLPSTRTTPFPRFDEAENYRQIGELQLRRAGV